MNKPVTSERKEFGSVLLRSWRPRQLLARAREEEIAEARRREAAKVPFLVYGVHSLTRPQLLTEPLVRFRMC